MKSFFRRHTLFVYLSGKLLVKVLGVAILLTAIMEVLALLEQMNPIIQRGLGISGISHYMALKLPLLFSSILPLSVLIGAIITLTQLTTAYEITILRAAGLSTLGLIKCFLPAILSLGLICIFFDDQVTPRTEIQLATWWNKTDPHPEHNKGFWFYQNLTLIKIEHLAYGGNKIIGLRIYKRSNLSNVASVLIADEASYDHGKWILSNAQELLVTNSKPLQFKKLTSPEETIWHISLKPRHLIELSSSSMSQSTYAIIGKLYRNWPARQPINFLKTALWERFFLPFTFIVMLMIAIPVVYIPPRAGLRSWLPLYCLGFGLLFVVFQGLLRALGNAGTLPAPMTVIPSTLFFFLMATAFVLKVEEK